MDHLHTLLGNLHTGILVVDEHLRVKYMNTAAEALLDISARRFQGESAEQLLADSAEWMQLLRNTRCQGVAQTRREMTLVLRSGSQSTMDIQVGLWDESSSPQLIVELHAIERLHRISREESVLQAQAATRETVRGLAHEIKNPLGGVRGATQLLAREIADPNWLEYTDIILQEVDRLTALVDRLLGPRQQLNLAPLNVHRVLEQVRKLVAAEMGARQSIYCDYDPSLPEIFGDYGQLMQAVLNIVRNAMQAIESTSCEHGQITLKTRVQRQITIGHRRHRMVCEISIIDNGPGIAEHLQAALFVPMVSGRADGTGLGLSLAQSIVTLHGGLLVCQSEPGNTVFTIYLPMESGHE